MNTPSAVRVSRFLACGFTLAALALAVFAATTPAGPSSAWTRITETTDSNINEPALARTADGVLHVVWLRKNGTKEDFMHTAIGADGRIVGAPVAALGGWASLDNPDLTATKDGGLRLFFAGLRSTETRDPYSSGSLFSATAPASGATWTLEKGAHAQSNSVYASPVGTAVMRDETPVAAWATSFALQAHIGLNPKTPDLKFQTSCCAYQPDLGIDAGSGEAVLGWFSNATKESGLYTQTIAPTAGEKQFVPGSATPDRNSSISIDQRMAITGRIGAPGVYVAYGAGYPTYKTVNLWRHGSSAPIVVANAPGARLVNISAGPEGRLWVMWQRSGRAYATRSNRDATRFGAIVEAAPPAGKASSGIFKVKGEGSVWPLDLFLACQSGNELATYHTQVFPGLSVGVTPKTVTAAQGGTVTFEVTDAGDPVAGASISVAGKPLTADAKGHASLPLAKASKPGPLTATATKSGYTPGSIRIVVK